MNDANLPLSALTRELKQVFSAAVDYQEGKIMPEQLKMAADKSAWRAARLLHPSLVPIKGLTCKEVHDVFPDITLFKGRKAWMRARVEIPLPRPFRRMMSIRDFPEERSDTRRTGLDILLQFVYQNVDSSISKNLSLQRGLEFMYKSAILDGEKCFIYGTPYFSLWHGERDDMAVNFVAVYSKKPATHGEAQVLAYMAMIHKERKRRGKDNCTVYGLSTDADRLWFYQIDESSEWSYKLLRAKPDIFTMNHREIVGLLAYIFREASLLSSSSSKSTSDDALNAQVAIDEVPHRDTDVVSYEELKSLGPPGVETWIN